MADLTAFEQYYKLADRLIAQSTKEQLAERARACKTGGDEPAEEMTKVRLIWTMCQALSENTCFPISADHFTGPKCLPRFCMLSMLRNGTKWRLCNAPTICWCGHYGSGRASKVHV